MTIEKPERDIKDSKGLKENSNSKNHRDFGRHNVYMPKNISTVYADNTERSSVKYSVYTGYNGYNGYNGYTEYNEDNRFRFKNSLIITPNYEIEFNGTGGIKYLKNHDGCVFFTGSGIFAKTNGIQKIPVLLKREIHKLSGQKKLIVEEKYNYEEKYEVYQNIVLYYEENRIDFQIVCIKSVTNPVITNDNTDITNSSNIANIASNKNSKDITAEFSLNLTVPGIADTVAYKKFSGKQEYKNLLSKLQNSAVSGDSEFDKDSPILENVEYIVVKCGKSEDLHMTVYPENKQILKYKNKILGFAVPVIPNLNQDKIYINLKIYLEKYKIT